MKNLTKTINFILPILTAAVFSGVYLSGALTNLSNRVNDLIYQQGDLAEGDINIIEIDEHSLDELGPYQTWTRDYIAEAIELLNADPDINPSVIGVDILFVGNSNEESDAHLVKAASLADNVVVGSYLNMENGLRETDNGYVMDRIVSLYEEPYEALANVTSVGFVNGFSDKDGIIRHALLEKSLDDGRTIPSFAYQVYKKYAEDYGLEDTLSIPENREGMWYLDYTGTPETYSSGFSLSDFIQGEIPVEYFTDSIVLIGPYASAMMDGYTTSISHDSLMYGVEIHANALESMIRGTFKKEASETIMVIIIAIIAMGAVLVCITGKLRYSFIYTGLMVIGYPLVCIFVYKQGLLLDIIYVPILALIVMVANIGVHYLKAAQDKKKIEKTFKRYVAPEVIEEISKNGMETIKLGGEAVECAILFVDIRGFTTMSELLEPEEVVSILNKYLSLTSGSIFKYGGTLDKFIGDATMAIFGAPLPQEDYIYQAVRAAYDMVECSKELSVELEKEFGRSVSFGVGVHCGRAVVGNIGTERRMDYTAIGDTVNTAARLEANAPAGTVLISDAVYRALEGRIDATSIGNIPLKGKSADIEVFKLEGIR